MSDLRPFPEIAGADLFDRLDEIDRFQTPFSSYLGAKVGEGWWNSIPGQVTADLSLPQDDRRPDPTIGVHRGPPRYIRTETPILSENEWKASEFYRAEIPYDGRMTPARAQAKAEVFDENAYRRWLIDRSPTGLRSVAGFGAEMLGGAPDPINFLPIAGPAAKAAIIARAAKVLGPKAGRVAATAAIQGAEGVAGAAAAQPFLIPSKAQFGDDTSYSEAALDIAFAGLFGGSLGAAHGGWTAWRGHGAVDDMAARQAGADLLSQAAGDLAAGRPVSLAPEALNATAQLRRQVEGAEGMVWRPGEEWPADVLAAQVQARAMPETIDIATPERDALRGQIASDLYGAGAAAKDRQAVIVLGPPAAGKSTIADPLAAEFRALVIDSDAAKAKLPEFQGGIGAMAVHAESDMIAGEMAGRAIEAGDNLVLPLVGKTLDNIRQRIQFLREAGYKIHLVLADLPNEKAVNRAIKRFREEGRFVDPDYVRSVGDSPASTYNALKSEADSYARYSNEVPRGSQPQLIEKGGQRYQSGDGEGPGPDVPGPGGVNRPLPDQGDAGHAGADVPDRQDPAGTSARAAQAGRQDLAITSAGRRVPVRYEVVEAASLTTSHDGDLAVNPAFPAELQPRDRGRAASQAQIADMASRLDPELLGRTAAAGDGAPIVGPDNVVESGNGRSLAIRRAYAEDMPSAARYRDWLAEQGFDVEGLKEPVLIRRRLGELAPADRAAFAREANERTTLSMGATERALADARNFTSDLFDTWHGGDVAAAANRDFVRAWLDTLPTAERGALVDAQGRLSQDGVRRLQAALLARAYEDPHLIGGLLESTDDNMRTIGKVLTEMAPDWIKLREAAAAGDIVADMDQTYSLMQAVGMVRRARDTGTKLRDLADQLDMFDPRSAEVRGFLQVFYGDNLGRALGQDKLRMAIGRYIDQANLNLAGARLFGEPLSAGEILAAARGDAPKQLGVADPVQADPDIDAAAARASQPSDIETLARDLGIDPESAEFDEAASLAQIEAGGRLRADEAEAIRAADTALKQADDYAAGLDAAAVCAARVA